MKNLKIKVVRNKKDLDDVFKIREVVFIKGQKVPKKIERDKFDEISTHILAIYKNKPIGCARIRFVGTKAKLQRVAVLKEYRGMGFGIEITKFAIFYCRRKGAREIVTHSQYYIKDLYAKCGFSEKGKIFMEAGIKHIEMRLKLI